MNAMSEIETGYHYQLMRRAIDVIDARGQDLSLEDIAREMRLSPAHFQRIFSRWAGVSPKRYQQWLALDHAKGLLATRHTTLETADAVGLSGSGRLHDLFVRWEAMSPGDYAEEQADIANREQGKAKIETIRNREIKVGRNEPCTCGSGRKYKSCCMRKRER